MRKPKRLFCYDEGVSKDQSRRAKKKDPPPCPASHWPRWLGAAAALLVLGAGALAFYTRHAPVKHIILVSIDTLRADHLSCYGYEKIRTPNIDRLAEDGVAFDNAATATPLTLPAHASIFTGRSPLGHGLIDNFGFVLEESEETIAELLQAAGFATGGFVGSFVLDSRAGIGQGFDTYFDRFEAPTGKLTSLESNQRPGDRVLSPALDWIRSQGDRPFFAFIHFFDPHTPYAPPEPYRSDHGPGKVGLYDGEIAFVDSLVGELVAFLEERDLYHDALVIILGDHGEALGDHGEETHGYFVYDETIRVPLIVKAPGAQAGGRAAAQVRSIDILPTTLDLAGVAIPPAVEGVSLRSHLRDPEKDLGLTAYIETHYTRLHFGAAPLRGIRTDRYKFIEAPQPELYDLRADPTEAGNVFGENKAVADQLASALERWVQKDSVRNLSPSPVDAETEQRLRALGYMTTGTESSVSRQDWKSLPDPKDSIDLFNQLTSARAAIAAGEADRATEILNRLLEKDPDVMLAHMMLGEALLLERQFDEAVGVFRTALEKNDRSPEAAYGLALAYLGTGRLPEAAAGFERCLSLDPRHDRAGLQLAEIRLRQDRPAEAEKLARQTLAERSSTSLQLLLADALLAQDKRDAALAALEQALDEAPDNPLVYLNLGNVLMEAGKIEEAVSSYRRAAELAPGNGRVFNGLGNALARLGETREALEAFRKAVTLDPSFAPGQNNLGIALATLGRPADAEKAFRKAIESDPAYAEAYNNLGFLYLQAGAVGEAIPLFRRALTLRPDYEQARSNLAVALEAQGRD